ncbi:flagellar hook assembly protein FlgD [Oryzomonas japonica]|uniref:Basal-body rod modification protein FlgD n=2 Tax=Oryzomonas TaxID=2855184 RepID=A0A5A9XBC0_9BACT|nr:MULTISPECIES: FlgD immunoglobulin-like domain containing protein [Oryzomonas]KAA0889745.1 flagellar hook assembly protein FlgD [Oryzomonas rubra]KAB0667187.1 flagellar hook assembly protein FlgD [Oryzomonas japonica]
MVSSVTSTTNTSSASVQMQKDLGFTGQDFLKLFVAQLQNQDPLSPQDSSAFLGQLAQMSQVEQAYNTNTNLTSLLTAQNNATSMNSVSFIGKTVKANGNSVAFDGTSAATLQYNLAGASTSSTVTITDASGKTVRTATVAAQSAGDNTFTWDGRDSSGTLLPAGAYTFAVSSTSASGSAVTATPYTTGTVNGVAFVNGVPTLTIGSVSVALSDVLSVKGV